MVSLKKKPLIPILAAHQGRPVIATTPHWLFQQVFMEINTWLAGTTTKHGTCLTAYITAWTYFQREKTVNPQGSLPTYATDSLIFKALTTGESSSSAPKRWSLHFLIISFDQYPKNFCHHV